MTNCENCIHKYVCKNYPVDSLPPIVRQSIFKKLDEECKEFVDNADVNLVVHGEWKKADSILKNAQLLCCSVCGQHQYVEIVSFCPHCGARMDGENND